MCNNSIKTMLLFAAATVFGSAAAESPDGNEKTSLVQRVEIVSSDLSLSTKGGIVEQTHQNAEVNLEYTNGDTLAASAENVLVIYSQDSELMMSEADASSIVLTGDVSLQRQGHTYRMDYLEIDPATGILSGVTDRLSMR